MEYEEVLAKRRSIRKFKPRFVSLDKIIEIIDAGRYTPLAGNVSILKCIVIEEPKTIEEIAVHADQPWIAQANKLIVVCSNEKKLAQLYDERASRYAKQQTGAAIQNMLLRATDLGLGACWIGSYLDLAIKQKLNIPAEIELEGLIVIGYPDEAPSSPRKTELENIVVWEQWGQSKRPTIAQEPTTQEGQY